ncbi:MAG: UDP-N-acetylmuramate--L-alanine ligase [Candidatus Omnitrophica bacterium]|nr:UDP-N-acetylmuramate--L-alanine ligase [Candidatus Omnitrophota bacterium]MCM8830936.1 UDP-N-acetylmuramate--L-alanine ligase [Candidatus Omnitrophota bacterium]
MKDFANIKNIYFIGIGGIGMSGLAILLKDKGFNVRGSDIKESYTVDMLRKDGIKVYIGHNPQNLTADIDLVIYSSAIKEDNPELIEAKKNGVSIVRRGELLGLLCADKKTIAVSGSHGKTTTTALLGYLLNCMNYKPTVFVGGLPLNYSKNAWWGEEYFVIETDESDGTFLNYNPVFSIITNIDKEHLDYYKSHQNLYENFLKFAKQTKQKVIGCADDPLVKKIILQVGGISYGFGENNYLRAANFYYENNFSCFDFIIGGDFVKTVKVPLLGEHNALNTLAVLGFFLHIGEDINKVIDFLKGFKGTKRRFQIKAKINDVTFIDDYAHHPTEIYNVLRALRYLKPKRVLAIFQPHRYSRVYALYKEFASAFVGVDELIVTDIYSASEKNVYGISVDFLIEEIKKNFKGKISYVSKEKLPIEVPSHIKEGDFVVSLGAGDINLFLEDIIYEFKRSRVKAES